MTSLDNLYPLLGEYVELKVKMKAMEARIKELDKQVRPALLEAGVVEVGGHTITCTQEQGRKTLNKQALIDDGIDVEQYMKQGAPFTKLTVK